MDKILKTLLTNELIGKISDNLGTNSQKTKSAMENILPAILGGLAKNSAKKEKADLLHQVLEKDHDGSILNNVGDLLENVEAFKGNKILGHIWGEKSSLLAEIVGQKSGLGKEKSGKLMEVLAPLVMGALGKETKEKELQSGDLSGLLQQTVKKFADNDELKKLVFSFLDKDGDGDIKDDLLDMGKKYLKKFLS